MTKTLPAPLMLAALATAASLPLSSVRAEDGPKVYGKVGGWTVTEEFAQTCRLTAPTDETFRFTVSKGGGEVGYLGVRVVGSDRPQRPGVVAFAFDDTPLPGTLLGGDYFTPSGPDQEVITFFRSANTMRILVDGKARFSFSLKGSNAGYRMLVECASRWPDSRVPLTPPPAPTVFTTRPLVPSPQLDGPLPASREASPIRTDLWFFPYDVPVYADFSGSSTVGVTLTVSPRGEVTDCEVLELSDLEEANARVCDILISRAKFDPATDSNGTAIASRYSTKITF